LTMPQALLLSGSGGVGKTTIAQAIGRLLTSHRQPTGVLDLDTIAQFGPPQPAPAAGLRFHDRLRVRNLAAVWTTYREAGAQFMVVSGHVESPELRAAYTESLADCDVQMIRLMTPPDLIAERTRTTRGPEWDLQAALDEAATHQPIQDHTVTNDRTPAEAAAEILGKLGWPSG
jgi:predicted kinase